MKYMLLIYWNQNAEPQTTPEQQQEIGKAWYALNQELEAAGVLLGNNGLAPITEATNVKVRNGRTLVADGPFAETHEHLAGYYLIDVKDLDEATAWAAKIPAAKDGTIEVRPLNVWSQQ